MTSVESKQVQVYISKDYPQNLYIRVSNKDTNACIAWFQDRNPDDFVTKVKQINSQSDLISMSNFTGLLTSQSDPLYT